MSQDYFHTLELIKPILGPLQVRPVLHLSHCDLYRDSTFTCSLSLLVPKALFPRQLPSWTSESFSGPCSSWPSSRTSTVLWFPIFVHLVWYLSLCLILLINCLFSILFSKTMPWLSLQKVNIPHLTQDCRLSQRWGPQTSACLEGMIRHFIMITCSIICLI